MNILQGVRSRHTFCVTLNDESRIAPELVLRRFEYQHPVFTTQRGSAQARHAEVLNANRTSFCGAYWRNGFHEDGVVSASGCCELPSSKRLWLWFCTNIDLACVAGSYKCSFNSTCRSRRMSTKSCIYEGEIRHGDLLR